MDRRLRLDLTDSLTYWVKPGPDMERDFLDLLSRARIGGDKPPYVLGDSPIVGFTEVPLALSAKLLCGAKDFGINYAPVGLLFERRWVYEHGGRPVIYQRAEEAALLPAALLYRHVTLDFDQQIDFTWKREWRIPTSALDLQQAPCRPVLPTAAWLARAREALVHEPAALALLDRTVVLEHFL
jgi:hypothetical protein